LAIIIGCSGSTGSSLLKTILNRHSQIFAGPETCLFAYPDVYQDWTSIKPTILKEILTDGWVIRRGMNLLQAEYEWAAKELQQAIQQSTSFQHFVNTFFDKPLQSHHKKIWIEKTPVNAYGFRAFLENYPNGKVIQIVRNPYDTIASLMARGMNAYYATGYYVYNTAIATSLYEDPRYYQLKYEDLVTTPIPTLQGLFEFLEIPFEKEIVQAKHEQRAEPTIMQGWQHHETAAVAATSVGRFQQLSLSHQQLIHTTLAYLKIHPTYLYKHQILFPSANSLCEKLDYPLSSTLINPPNFSLKKYYWRDRAARLRYHGIDGFWNYLATIY